MNDFVQSPLFQNFVRNDIKTNLHSGGQVGPFGKVSCHFRKIVFESLIRIHERVVRFLIVFVNHHANIFSYLGVASALLIITLFPCQKQNVRLAVGSSLNFGLFRTHYSDISKDHDAASCRVIIITLSSYHISS